MRLSDDNSKADLAAVYAAAGTPEYAVINEDGVCGCNCHCRRLDRNIWISVDDVDGYELMDEQYFTSLEIVPLAEYVPLGYDRNGNVVPA